MKHAALLLGLAFAGAAAAQAVVPAAAPAAPLPPGNTQPKAPPAMAMPMPTATLAPSPATQEFTAKMSAMMTGMAAPYTGETDRDFVTHMLPHHQGAIDMAETELKYGHDPKMKLLASRIISAQQREIAFMQGWLEKHPAKK